MIEQLPLFVPSLQQEQSVVTLVDRILAAKKADPVADTSGLEAEIDQLVYKLYGLTEKLSILNDPVLWSDFGHLQESDHLYYMCTKFFSDGEVHKYFNPYDTPYEAFINYMNVLSDFIIRTDEAYALKTSDNN